MPEIKSKQEENLPDETPDKTIEISNKVVNEIIPEKQRFVVPYGRNQWAVMIDGEKNIEYLFRNKREAVKLATSEAKRTYSVVTIQKKNGKIQRRISYNSKSKAKKNR